MTCGIYKLTFPSGKFYIGKSINMEKRWRQHYDSMVKGTHTKAMQTEFDLWGTYTEEVMFECHEDHIDIMEDTFINWRNPPLNSTSGRDRLIELEDLEQLPLLLPYFTMSTVQHVAELHNTKNKVIELIETLGNKESTIEERDEDYDALQVDLKESEVKVECLEAEVQKYSRANKQMEEYIVAKEARIVSLFATIDELGVQRTAEEIEKDTLSRLAHKDKMIEQMSRHADSLNMELNTLSEECNKLWKYKKLPWYKKIFA